MPQVLTDRAGGMLRRRGSEPIVATPDRIVSSDRTEQGGDRMPLGPEAPP